MSHTDVKVTLPTRPLIAHRIVQAGIFLTLVWKWAYFRLSAEVYRTIPLDDPFFPDVLRSVATLSAAYLLTLVAVPLSFLTTSMTLRRVCGWITVIGTTLMCLHQGSYNDMTFVTAWWTSLWSLWFVHRDWSQDPETLLRRGAFLSRLLISLILLGGAIGKWTPEYWSGEVFFDIYFRDRDYWVFNLLRARFDTESLREIAMWYSRQVVVIETLGGFGLWLLPPRLAAVAAMVILASIALLSNLLLFSVLSCLIGLAAVGLLVKAATVGVPASRS